MLMVRSGRNGAWILPGGMAIAKETPAAAAVYQARRRLSLDIHPGPVLVIDHVPENDRTGAKEGINIVFHGGVLTDDQASGIKICAARTGTAEPELTAFRFMDGADLRYLVASYLQSRIRAAEQQLSLGGIPYLHYGKPINKAA
ncbi:hypothetical protein CTZ27_26410 [Streptomyces griseocarneus]|nr:hypothetical protein CTZ27_26410 [Streptomyces griseocarneus]